MTRTLDLEIELEDSIPNHNLITFAQMRAFKTKVEKAIMATQADVDALTAQVGQVAADLSTLATTVSQANAAIQVELNKLQAASPQLDLSGLQTAIAPLDQTVQALVQSTTALGTLTPQAQAPAATDPTAAAPAAADTSSAPASDPTSGSSTPPADGGTPSSDSQTTPAETPSSDSSTSSATSSSSDANATAPADSTPATDSQPSEPAPATPITDASQLPQPVYVTTLDPSTIDASVWPASGYETAGDTATTPLFFFSGDTPGQPATGTGVEGWTLYQGAIQPVPAAA